MSSEAIRIASFLVIFGTGMGAMFYFLTLRPWLGKRRCARELPRRLVEHGFAHFPSRVIGAHGTYGGEVGGHLVWLDVDNGLIKVWLDADRDLELEEHAPTLEPDAGKVAFDSASPALDRRFRTRYADPEIATRLAARTSDVEAVDAALRRLGRGWLRIRGEVIEHHPLPVRFPEYLPMSTFDRWFGAVTELAAAIDRLLPAAPDEAKHRRRCQTCGGVRDRYPGSQDYASCSECRGSA